MLVAAIVGLETRVIIEDIIAINKESPIMEEHDYPGLRFVLDATIEKIHDKITIDISTGDIITPAAVMYSYRLMFEDRAISLLTYNLETVFAEKLETMMARGTANTRMRDFYDVYILYHKEKDNINTETLIKAFYETSEKRNTTSLIPNLMQILNEVLDDENMRRNWDNYQHNNYYVEDLPWEEVMESVISIANILNK